MGNEAIAMGAIAAGVNLTAGYPGTPSTEVLETMAKRRPDHVYVEWSVNEKAALETAAGASYAGARTMVTMKQVGLNVASDPLMCVEYIGVKGGMVILVADDPGPISSQTEQDTRTFAMYSKCPCFDPSSVQEAYEMVQEAFEVSERYGTPVFLRPTTRICHSYASVIVKSSQEYLHHSPEGFIRDSNRWVIFPRLANRRHGEIEARNETLSSVFSDYTGNRIIPAAEDLPDSAAQPEGTGTLTSFADVRRGIAAGGISFAYARETIEEIGMASVRLFQVATPFPFPEEKALAFLDGLDEVLCLEELDPVIERALIHVCGKYHLHIQVYGKLSHHTANKGENTRESISADIAAFLGRASEQDSPRPSRKAPYLTGTAEPPVLPVRPPVLCAGCPHRASFYAVKKAMKGKKTIFCGDIGCYTLGNAQPLDMVDTCLCMGAGLGIAQGVWHIEPDTTCFAFVGDSTFFASAITGVVNAVYNQADMILIVLDNSTTAMTGHQPHPGTGRTAMGEVVQRVSIENVLRGIGVDFVETVNPFALDRAVSCVKEAAGEKGVKAIIFKAPCIAVCEHEAPLKVGQETCIHCRRCIKEIGCPALYIADGQIRIDAAQCTGCSLCMQICPVGAIRDAAGSGKGA